MRLPFHTKIMKGNSMVEYALLLALLGGTSASMVLHFGTALSNNLQNTSDFYAQTQKDARLVTHETAPLTLPVAQATSPYQADLAQAMDIAQHLKGTGPITWTASELPAGLSLNDQGLLSGQPAPGTHQFTATARRGDHAVRAQITLASS